MHTPLFPQSLEADGVCTRLFSRSPLEKRVCVRCQRLRGVRSRLIARSECACARLRSGYESSLDRVGVLRFSRQDPFRARAHHTRQGRRCTLVSLPTQPGDTPAHGEKSEGDIHVLVFLVSCSSPVVVFPETRPSPSPISRALSICSVPVGCGVHPRRNPTQSATVRTVGLKLTYPFATSIAERKTTTWVNTMLVWAGFPLSFNGMGQAIPPA